MRFRTAVRRVAQSSGRVVADLTGVLRCAAARPAAVGVVAGVISTFSPVALADTIFVIGFESDPPGAKVNGFESVDSSLVTFTDSVGGFTGDPMTDGLLIGDFGDQSQGQGLLVATDNDDSALAMDFLTEVIGLSLDFGNDEPGQSSPGDEAVLTVLRGGVEVGEARLVLNRNDAMDQTISIFGVGPFDRAVFKFDVNPAIGLSEVVDNITVHVPEPAFPAVLALLACSLRPSTRRR